MSIAAGYGDPRQELEQYKNLVAQLQTEIERKDAQIREAISILLTGTDYEKLHVSAILSDALQEKKDEY